MDKVWWKKQSSLKSLIEVGKAIETASRICMKIENNWYIFFPWLEHIFSRCWMFSQHIYIFICNIYSKYSTVSLWYFYKFVYIFLQKFRMNLRKSNFLWLKNKIRENSKSWAKKNVSTAPPTWNSHLFGGVSRGKNFIYSPSHREILLNQAEIRLYYPVSD